MCTRASVCVWDKSETYRDKVKEREKERERERGREYKNDDREKSLRSARASPRVKNGTSDQLNSVS